MCLAVGSLIAGAVAGGGVQKVPWRSLFKSSIKQGIKATRSVQAFSADAREQAKRMVAEVRAELDPSEQQQAGSRKPGTSKRKQPKD
ncbi:MAG TPA: hypothetical protein VK604_21510 [Bryobacteraceae bacterium]|nr:hypothetical protein [Bryobacteraceae bacterium]